MKFSLTRWKLGYHEAFSRTFPFHDGILAIMNPFHELFFFTMEFWISRSLFTNFSFSRWNSGYHEAFSRTFLFHDGILAITKPFHELFFFTIEFWLSRSLLHESRWNYGYHEAFHTIKFTKCTNWGRTLFYISQRVFTQDPSR
jgi:hypothetical protein